MTHQTLLRALREQRGGTITSTAQKLNIGVSRYYMIEAHDRPATAELARQTADILGVSQETLFMPQSFTARESTHERRTTDET